MISLEKRTPVLMQSVPISNKTESNCCFTKSVVTGWTAWTPTDYENVRKFLFEGARNEYGRD